MKNSNRLNFSDAFRMDNPNITVSDYVDNPRTVINANLRSAIYRNRVTPEEIPVPGITLEDMQPVPLEDLYLFNNMSPLLNYFNSIVVSNSSQMQVPNKIYGCHVKLANDNLPDIELFSDEKKRKVALSCHMFCFVDETEMSEYTTLKKDTLVKVQIIDQNFSFGKIVQAQNYISGLITVAAGGTADNFSGELSLVGSAGTLFVGNYQGTIPEAGLLNPLGDIPSTLTGRAGEVRSSDESTKAHIHAGIDLVADEGTPIYAAAAGKVIKASNDTSKDAGNAVWLEHKGPDGKNYYTVYMHMFGAPLVSQGQQIDAGTQLGALGNTGHSTGHHLHFEVRIGTSSGEVANPLEWISDISKIKPSNNTAKADEQAVYETEKQRRAGVLTQLPKK